MPNLQKSISMYPSTSKTQLLDSSSISVDSMIAVSGFALCCQEGIQKILGIVAMTVKFLSKLPIVPESKHASRTGNSKCQRPVFSLKKHTVVRISSLRLPHNPYGTKSANFFLIPSFRSRHPHLSKMLRFFFALAASSSSSLPVLAARLAGRELVPRYIFRERGGSPSARLMMRHLSCTDWPKHPR